MKKVLINLIRILSEVSVTDEKHKVPLHSVVQPVWSGGNPEYGAVKGGMLAVWRILRCNPFSRGGYDPVP